MDTNERLNELDMNFAALIAAVNHNALDAQQKLLVEDLLKEWHSSERLALMLADPSTPLSDISQEITP